MGNDEKRLSSFEQLLEDVKGKHSKRVNAILLTQSSDGSGSEDDFLVNYFKILEYASPKLTRAEVITDETEQVITIEHSFREDKK